MYEANLIVYMQNFGNVRIATLACGTEIESGRRQAVSAPTMSIDGKSSVDLNHISAASPIASALQRRDETMSLSRRTERNATTISVPPKYHQGCGK